MTPTLRTHIYFPSFTTFHNAPKFPCFFPIKAASPPRFPFRPLASSAPSSPLKKSVELSKQSSHNQKPSDFDAIRAIAGENYRVLIVGAVSVGVLLFLMGCDEQKALALGPEGPLVEEFWDNVRRYALYALTVSTGAIYTVFQPILELLKNPISAVLVVAIFGGGIFIVSQVISAMIGVSEFSYDYAY